MYLMISESSFIDSFSKYQRRQFGFQSLVLELKIILQGHPQQTVWPVSSVNHNTFATKTFHDKVEIEI